LIDSYYGKAYTESYERDEGINDLAGAPESKKPVKNKSDKLKSVS